MSCRASVDERTRTRPRSTSPARLMRHTLGGCLVVGQMFLMSAPARAQTAIESNAGIQFDFSNPGARSLALGGAFVGLADDATAAFTNPAGLRVLSRKEVSIEGRGWSFATPYTSGGRLSGTPTQLGVDQTAGLTVGESHQSTEGLSFLSFVYPSARWAVAAYRQQLADFSYSAESQGPFAQVANRDFRLFPYRATLNAKIARYGVSGSYRIGDNVSVGAGVYLQDFSMTSDTQRFNVDPNRPALYAAPNFSSASIQEDTQTGSDHRVGVTVGVTATPTSRFELGAVYRQGAHFQLVTADLKAGQQSSSSGIFSVPDVFAVGVSVRPTDPLRIVLDYDRVRYSQIADNFSFFFRPATAGTNVIQPQDYKVDDANEVHVGVEYVFLKTAAPLAVRAGTWYDPDHSIRFEPSSPENADPYASATFRRGKNVVHGSGGVGVVLGSVEVNAAGDFSSRTTTVSVSAVVRF
jgi:long-chain fatty acid transport protein